MLYLFRWTYLKSRKDLYDNLVKNKDFHLSQNHEIDIDTWDDFRFAELVVEDEEIDLSWAQ